MNPCSHLPSKSMTVTVVSIQVMISNGLSLPRHFFCYEQVHINTVSWCVQGCLLLGGGGAGYIVVQIK